MVLPLLHQVMPTKALQNLNIRKVSMSCDCSQYNIKSPETLNNGFMIGVILLVNWVMGTGLMVLQGRGQEGEGRGRVGEGEGRERS